jgi:hypothetical protein
MKTTRRHELQTNELADSLAHWIEAIKPYSRAALALVVALVVLIFAWSYFSAQSSRRNAEGWNEYFDAFATRDPREPLAEISSRYAGTPVSEWARLALADVQLEDGTTRLFVEKKDGRDELVLAAEKYQAILVESRQTTLLERATFGLARAHEALAKPESLEKARKEYRSIAQQWPNSVYASIAEKRADDLDRQATKGFYDWLAAYEPPRPLAKEPGTPGVRPDFLKDPLEGAGLQLPSATDGNASLPKFDLDPSGAPPAGDAPDADTKTDSEPPSEPSGDKTEAPPGDKPAEPQSPPADAPPEAKEAPQGK